MKALAASRVFDGLGFHTDAAVLVSAGHVVDVVPRGDVPGGVAVETLSEGMLLAPGFVDLQVNGGGGVMFNATPTLAGLRAIAEAHARIGTTAILPTLISSGRALRETAIAVAAAAVGKVPGIIGLHLEGPFLAPARHGIHPLAAMTVPGEADMAALTAVFPGPLLITLAPDIVSIPDISILARAGRFVFAGHTDASYAQAMAGFEAGIVGATHLFNAMSQFGSREPGMVGAAMQRGMAGIIMDGFHVHPASVALAYRSMGPGRLFLVSDAMATTGSDQTGFDLDTRRIALVDGRLTDATGTLAGAHLSMAEAVQRAVALAGIPLQDALRMATRTPAEAIGVVDRGRIAVDSHADLVALDDTLAVRAVWRGGERLAIRSPG